MPIGLFDSFDNLDQISPDEIVIWLKPSPVLTKLEDYLANKILYPQALSVTEPDMKMDLAILRAALKLNGPKSGSQKMNALLGDNPFLNITLRKILIPLRFLEFVPDLISLTWVFVDALLLNRKKEDWFQDLWTVVLTNDADDVVGSVLLPQFEDGGSMDISLLGRNYKIRKGDAAVLPCQKDRCEIAYKLQKGKILGKETSAIEVYGGKLGIMVDGRGV